jgi:uncharacterized membrane protein
MVDAWAEWPALTQSTGQILDVIGFIILAKEWRIVWGSEFVRVQYVADAQPGERAAQIQRSSILQAISDKWVAGSQVAKLRKRKSLFNFGVCLVILGFLLQFLGTFPVKLFLAST